MEKVYSKYRNLYFLGIGGIGMSALARYFHRQGYDVAGYDKFSSEITDVLMQMGIPVSFQDHADALPGHWKLAETAVVLTPAVPKDLQLYTQFQNLGLDFYKRSQVLGWLSQELPTVAVAGTHGKTSTTAMVTHVLKTAGKSVLAFIGGITNNYGSNIVMDKNPEFLVVEADEFDRSFLQLHPSLSIITSTDPDHLDIYSNSDQFFKAFEDFTALTKDLSVVHSAATINAKGQVKRYVSSEVKVSSIKINDGKVNTSLQDHEHKVSFTWHMPGQYNSENALAAFCISNQLNIPIRKYQQAMETFTGVQRRFDVKFQGANAVLIDDYAHHPKEIQALKSALDDLYPDKKITIVFQPHLYSRTRDFETEFAEALDRFDEVLLMPIYPAREEPITGVTSENLLSKLKVSEKCVIAPFDLLHYAAKFKGDVLVMAGAGDISKMVEPVRKVMASTEA